MEIRKVKIKDLNPATYNPRNITEESLKGLEASLSRFGYVEPICWNEKTGNVVGGHQRLKVLQKKGEKEVDVVVVSLNDIDEKALNVALNNKHIQGDWDYGKLDILLSELKIEFEGYDEIKLDALEIEMGDNIETEEKDIVEDEAPEIQEKTICKKGDLWTLGKHRLLCGDSTSKADVLLLLQNEKPILMVTDPPYGVDYDPTWRHSAGINNSSRKGKVENDDRINWTEVYSNFDAQVAYVWHADRHAKEVQESMEDSGFIIVCQIIWVKQQMVFGRGDYHWKHEPCWYAVKKGKNHNWQGDRTQTTVWEIKNLVSATDEDSKTTHGTQKPIECMAKPIKNNSATGEIICDPFLGSGTTLIACEQLDRICYGMEISEKYCDVIIRRFQNISGKDAIRQDGKKFNELETNS